MGYKEPEFMRKLHQIREKLTKEEENLTKAERIARAKADSEWVKKRVAALKKEKESSKVAVG